MSAVIGVLNESLTDGIKGFYKLRKAYIILDGILESEKRYMQGKDRGSINNSRKTSTDSLRSTGSARSTARMPGGFDDEGPHSTFSPKEKTVGPRLETGRDLDDNASEEFYDADEGYEGLDNTTEKVASTSSDNNKRTLPSQPVRQTTQHMLDHSPGSDVFGNPIDVFIHSGSNLCFGFLLLLISMVSSII